MPVPVSEAVSRRSLRELATERIRQAILDGTLEPGERLHDQELMSWLGVSRTPLRDALNELARVGLVEMRAQRYTRVVAPDDALSAKYLQTLGALLSGVVRVAVPELPDGGVTSLVRWADRAIDAITIEDCELFAQRVRALLGSYLEYCDNEVLVEATRDTVDATMYRFMLTQAANEPIDWPQMREHIVAMRDATIARDGIGVQLALGSFFRLP